MKLCIAGKHRIAVDGLRLALSRLDRAQVLVCPNADDDGHSRWQPSLRRHATELGVSIMSLDEVARIPDLLFLSLEFDRVLRPAAFTSTRLFNLHFSKLPAYRGVYTSAWPILNDDAESGVTLHRIDAGIDSGDIVAQCSFRLSAAETARSLYHRYLAEAATLLHAQFDAVLADTVSGRPQSTKDATSHARSSIDYAHLSLDLDQNTAALDRQVRAYSFREFQLPQLGGMAVAGVQRHTQRPSGPPGTILRQDDDGVWVATRDGDAWAMRDRSLDLLRLTDAGEHAAIARAAALSDFVDVVGRSGRTPLMIAAGRGDTRSCKALLSLGANVDHPDCDGTTALRHAADHGQRSGDFSACAVLLDHGADRDRVDAFGISVIDRCARDGQNRAVAFLRAGRAGAGSG